MGSLPRATRMIRTSQPGTRAFRPRPPERRLVSTMLGVLAALLTSRVALRAGKGALQRLVLHVGEPCLLAPLSPDSGTVCGPPDRNAAAGPSLERSAWGSPAAQPLWICRLSTCSCVALRRCMPRVTLDRAPSGE